MHYVCVLGFFNLGFFVITSIRSSVVHALKGLGRQVAIFRQTVHIF